MAVQGHSFDEIFGSLQEAIALYLEIVADFTLEEQRSLLRRSAPLSVGLTFLGHAVRGDHYGDHQRDHTSRTGAVLKP